MLSPRGVPTPLAATRLLPPDSLMAPLPAGRLRGDVAASPFHAKYGTTVDRDSAHERITGRHRGGPAARGEAATRAGLDPTTAVGSTNDPGPASTRARPPAEGDRGRPEGGPSAKPSASEGPTRRPRRPRRRRARRRSTPRCAPGGKVVTSRLGQDIVRGVFGVSVRRREGPLKPLSATPGGGRSGPTVWTESVLAGRDIGLGDRAFAGRGSRHRGPDRAAPHPSVVHGLQGPDRRRAVLAEGGGAWNPARGGAAGPLRRVGADHVLLPLAADTARGWMLLPDGGPRLRDLAPEERGDHDLEAWIRMLPVYAEVQRSVEARAAALVTAGVPDLRAERLVGILDGLLGNDALWARVDPGEVEAGIRARGDLARRRADIAALAADLARSGIHPTIEHGDLHGANILVRPDGVRFYDWGDATVGHPFGTLATTLKSIAYRTGLEQDGPDLARVRDAYTEAWTDVLPRSALVEVADLAMDLAHISKSAAWDRAMDGVEPAEMGEFGDGAGGWLIDFADRMERRPATQ